MLKIIPFQNKNIKNVSGADMLEVWFDRFPKAETDKILSKIKKPFIYKVEKYDSGNLKTNALMKADFLDLDVSVSLKFVAEARRLNKKVKIIMSYHNYDRTPSQSELLKILKKMKAKKADVFKFATYAQNMVDSISMLNFLSTLNKSGERAICICMGPFGKITRMVNQLFGGFCMYFAQNSKTKTAEGQVTLKEFNKHII